MRRWIVRGAVVLVAACTPRPSTAPVVITTPPAGAIEAAPDRIEEVRARARRLRDEGKLDVAARLFGTTPRTPELDAMVADAWRYERVTEMKPVDLAFAKEVHAAFAAKRFEAIRPALAQAAESRDVDPEILVWLGRASEGAVSHRAYARARARLQELGFDVELSILNEAEPTNVGLVRPDVLVRTTMTHPPGATDWDGYFEIWDLGSAEPWRVVWTKDVASLYGFGVVPDKGRFMTFHHGVELREPDLGTIVSDFSPPSAWMTATSRRTGRVVVTEHMRFATLYEPDGKALATFEAPKDAPLDPKTQKPASSDPIKVAVSDDGMTFAVGGLDGSIHLGRVGAPVRKLPRAADVSVYPVGMTFRDSDRELVALFFDGTVATFDVATGRLKDKHRRRCTPDEWKAFNLAQPPQLRAPGPATVAMLESCGAASSGEVVAMGDALTVTGHGVCTLVRRTAGDAALPPGPITRRAAVDGARYLLAGTETNAFEVRDGESGKLLYSAPRRGLGGVVHDVSSDGRYLAVDDAIWDVTHERETAPRRDRAGVRFIADGATHVRWSGTTAEIADSATGEVRRALEHRDAIAGVDVATDTARLVIAGGAASIWSAAGDLVRRIEEAIPIAGATLSADGHVVATCSSDGSIRFYSVDDGALLLTTRAPAYPTGVAFPVAVSADGRMGATMTAEGSTLKAHVYDLRSGDEILGIDTERPVSALAFTPNGADVVVAMDSDVPFVVVDVRTGKEKARAKAAHLDRPKRPIVSPDGRTVRITSEGLRREQALHVWRIDGSVRTLEIDAVLGGWFAKSDAGAIAGSAAAHRAFGTSAVKGHQRLFFPADLGWDAFEAPDLVRRAIAGETVKAIGF